MDRIQSLNNLLNVNKIEVKDTILKIEINTDDKIESTNIEIIIYNHDKVFKNYKCKKNQGSKYLFEIDLKDFKEENNKKYKIKLFINEVESALDLTQKITIEKMIEEDNNFINKVIIKARNGKIKIETTTLSKLRPEVNFITFDEELHVEGEFKNDIKLLECKNIKIVFKLFNKQSGEELIKPIYIDNINFKFKIHKDDIFKINSLNNTIWGFYIDVLRDGEILSSEYLLFKDRKDRAILSKELKYNNYYLNANIYLTEKLKRVALNFNNDIRAEKVVNILSKRNKALIKIRTKKEIDQILNNFKISIIANNKEYKAVNIKINGKKTFTITIEIDKESLNGMIENGFILKEIINEKTFLEEIKKIDKDVVISNLKERLNKSKRYNKLLKKIYSSLLLKLPVKKKKILFESFLGRNCSGNPKYIYEYMVSKGLDKKYNLIWFFNDTNEEIIGSGKKIKRRSLKYYYHMATAKYWVFNTRQLSFIKKRKETIYLQTWHGTPLKKLGMDMDNVDMGGLTDIFKYKDIFYKNSRRWDLLISQNDYSRDIFRSAFAFEKEILNYGYPANDILYKKNNSDEINKIKDKFNIPKDKKVILYAPTWRDNNFIKKGHYKMEMKLELEKMQRHLGNEYIVLLRMHYLIMSSIDIEEFGGFAYNFSEGFDIQELYLVSDILITDYSSVMFDYSNLKRDILFFTYDIEEYRDSLRGFYFDFEKDAPGPIIKTTDEIIECILNLDDVRDDYKEKSQEFYNKFCSIDDGSASEKVVSRLLGINN